MEKETLEFVRKKDFESAKENYQDISLVAQATIDKAKELDVLALNISVGSKLKVSSAKIINEENPDAFFKLLQGEN